MAVQPLHPLDSERAFAPVFAILLASFQWPVWANRFLPMIDLPGHLAMSRMLHDLLADPASHFHERFMLRPDFTPYVSFYWLVEALVRAGVSIESAGRIYVALCVAGVPLAVLWLLVALGRSRWLALLALPLPYCMLFVLGFINTILGHALAVAALAAFAIRLQGGLRGPARAAVVALLPIACLLTHPQSFAFFVCGLLVMFVVWRAPASAGILALPSLAVFASWFIPIISGKKSGGGSWDVHYDPVSTKIAALDNELTNVFRDPFDFELLRAHAIVWVLLFAFAIAHAIKWSAARPSRATVVAIALAGGAIVAYLISPRAMLRHPVTHLYIYHRFALIAAMLAPAVLSIPRGGLPRAFAIVLSALAAVNGGYLVQRHAAFDREMAGFETFASYVEDASCYAPMWNDEARSSIVQRRDLFSHFGQYLTVWRGAEPGFPFAIFFSMPVAVRRADGRPGSFENGIYPAVWPHEVEQARSRGSLLARYPSYRYFLVPRDLERRFGDDQSKLEVVASGGPFTLLRNPAASCR